ARRRMRLRIEAANGAVGVEGGRIVPAEGRFDVALRIPDGVLRPGLINAHDHLHRNHYPPLGRPPYGNAYEWGRDIHARDAAEIRRARALPRREALLRGAWKNLFAGVTTVVHHDAWEPDFERDFPIRVARVRTAHSLGFEPDLAGATAPVADDPERPLALHLAEGVDGASADEVREADRLGLLDRRLLAVHVVGADDDGVRRLRAAGAAIVWCPTSNLFLFGRTAPPALLAPGVDVLLGSDSRLTGEGDLLDELRAARRLGVVDDARLLAAVGATAARRLRLPEPSLEVGSPADVAVFRRPVLEASAADVALVVVDGVVSVADPGLGEALDALGLEREALVVAGVARRVRRG
ncbi:MAG TPA: amidohydrolase family protein, partial [Longimicrobiales bacterium]|nr:amidohydrolase family protein [Longimicrobiales bacterium]